MKNNKRWLWIPRSFALLITLWYSFLSIMETNSFRNLPFDLLFLAFGLWAAFFVSIFARRFVAILYFAIGLSGIVLSISFLVIFNNGCTNAMTNDYNFLFIFISVIAILFFVFSQNTTGKRKS